MDNDLWLIGSGGMALEYAKVLQAHHIAFTVIGRGHESAIAFTKMSGMDVVKDGLTSYLHTKPKLPSKAIIAVGVEALSETMKSLIEYGVPNILVEKPGALTKEEIVSALLLAKKNSVRVFVAYNRRFYASTLRALELIAEDGGVKSFNFEFTEWGHEIQGLKKAPGVKDAWFLANSTHVADLAFYLGGIPTEMTTFTAGSLDWHPAASIFSGAGKTNTGAIFSYQANWGAPGRWGVETLTSNYRLIFRPMESLKIMKKGSINIEEVPLNDEMDKQFKPGLNEMVKRFLRGQDDGLCALESQSQLWDIYCKMANY